MIERRRVFVTGLAAMAGDVLDPASLTALLRETRTVAGCPLAGFNWEQRLAAISDADPALAHRARRTAGRQASQPLLATLAVAIEATLDGFGVPAERVGIVVAGSNLQLGRAWQAYEKFREQPHYLSPRHGYEFYDTHLMALIASVLEIRGPGQTVGGASASGNVALATALDWLRWGRADACLVVGPMPDLSPVEWQALGAMGALAVKPAICRPFDAAASGFVPGEACAAVLLQVEPAQPLAELAGAAVVLGASAAPGPDADGAVRAMEGAALDAGIDLEEIELISAHATSTPAGDAAECEALSRFLGSQCGAVAVNAPKSITGHALHAAGVVELVVLVQQMRAGFVHGTAKLRNSIAPDLDLIGPAARDCAVHCGLSNSFGFGSISTSIVVRSVDRL
jgi:malonyl-ACP decarboxylase